MIEAVVLESVVKVVDRFADLLKYRQARRKEIFSGVIEPLFNDLLVMHADYIKMFDDCQHQLVAGQTSLAEIAEALRQRRQVYEAIRIKSRSIIDGLGQVDLEPEVKRFLTAAAFHIPDGELAPVSSTPASMVLSSLYSAREQWAETSGVRDGPPSGTRKVLLDLVGETVSEIRQRWGWICEEYVRVKVWALH